MLSAIVWMLVIPPIGAYDMVTVRVEFDTKEQCVKALGRITRNGEPASKFGRCEPKERSQP